jgi:hypothetical protein
VSAAVLLTDTVPQAASPRLERFVTILGSRLAAGAGQADQGTVPGPAIRVVATLRKAP